jgi:hypothetical protein
MVMYAETVHYEHMGVRPGAGLIGALGLPHDPEHLNISTSENSREIWLPNS